jgi:iron complex outermembrane receptor protein
MEEANAAANKDMEHIEDSIVGALGRGGMSIRFMGTFLLCVIFQPTQAADSIESRGELDEIVVTAQRRSEIAQNVPIAVTAYSANDLQHIGAALSDDLPFMVPGLQMEPVGAFQPITLRGVGNNGTGAAVLTFVDGVYYPFQTGSLVFNNVLDVEVDKGPQGTLFGRNSTGGVVQITTKNPAQAATADVEVGYGNYDTRTLSLYASGGVAPKVAGDIAAYLADQREGWGTNLNTGAEVFTKKDVNLRSKWIFDASDRTRLRLIVDYDTSEGSEGTIVKPAATTNTIFNYVTNTLTTIPGKYDVDANYPPHYTTRTLGSNLRIDSDFDSFRVASISSWQENRTDLYIDYDGTPMQFFDLYRHDTRNAETQEFQVLSPDASRIKWVSGLYFYNDQGHLDPFRFSGIGAQAVFHEPAGDAFNIRAHDRITSYAAFGQVSAPVGYDTTLTVGARYTIDHRQIAGYTAGGTTVNPGSEGSESQRFEKPTFRISLDRILAPDVLGYASFNRGFDAGLFNLISTGGFTPAANPAVNPETIDAYELGVKSEWFEKRLRANMSAFIYDYKNLQQQIYQSAALITVNAAAARISGVDLDLQALPWKGLTVAAGMEYLHATFTRYPGAPLYSTGPLGELDTRAGDASGKFVPNAPRFSSTARATYRAATVVGTFDSTMAVSYVSFWYADPSNFYREPSHVVVNATEKWTSADEHSFLSLWVKNLGNTYYDLGINMLAPVGPVGNPGAPRTYGVTVGHHF